MIAALIEAFVASTIAAMLVLAVRGAVARYCGAGWAYALWLLPLALPILPPLPLVEPVQVSAATIVVPTVSHAAPALGGDNSGWTIVPVLLAAWLGGALFFLIWQQATYSAFRIGLGRERQGEPSSFGGIKVVQSLSADGPLAVGLFHRRIVVPADFARRYTVEEQQLALTHELIHHRRFDLWWNALAMLMLALNWFNPVAHFAFRAFRADQELACDEAVLRATPAARHAYACALVKSATREGLIGACALNHADFLKRRLKLMTTHRDGPSRSAAGMAAFGATALAGLVIGSPLMAQEERRPPRRVVFELPEKGTGTPFIRREELAVLESKCGGRRERDGDTAIVCDGDDSDPEVRAIIDRTLERAEAHVAAIVPPASPSPATVPHPVAAPRPMTLPTVPLPPAAPDFHATFSPPAPPAPPVPAIPSAQAIRAEVRKAMSQMHRALAHARLEMAQARRSIRLTARAHSYADVEARAAAEEALAAVEELDLSAELDGIDEEIDQSLRELDDTH